MTLISHDYHDATLRTATVDWKAGTVTIVFEICSQPAATIALTVDGVTDFRCPRKFPWGRSVSVNSLDIGDGDSALLRLQIEMQSGDQIVAVGKEISEKTVG
jgi:hypothetical protein